MLGIKTDDRVASPDFDTALASVSAAACTSGAVGAVRRASNMGGNCDMVPVDERDDDEGCGVDRRFVPRELQAATFTLRAGRLARSGQ